MVRYLREIFDNLLAILDSKQESLEINNSAFLALLHVVDQLTSKASTAWGPIVDSYIEEFLAAPSAHHVLLFLCKEKFRYAATHDKTPIVDSFKALTLLAKGYVSFSPNVSVSTTYTSL
jgi:hypothetical protein